MTDHSQRSVPLNRRRFLSVAATSAVVTGGFGSTAAAADASYVLEQNGNCVPLAPLRSGDETAAEFYDYRAPFTDPSGPTYSSYGTTDLQRDDASVFFLYEDATGKLSLVFVHGKLNGAGDGGSATFELAGLAESGEWAILDDDYEGPTNYDSFEQDPDSPDRWTANWTWDGGRTDGGVFTGLGDDFEVTIEPSFNQWALLFGQYYDGTVSDWLAVSGSVDDPEYIRLKLDEPVTIRRGSCGDGGGAKQRDRERDDDRKQGGTVRPRMSVLVRSVNPRSNRPIPVAIRSTEEFDATSIDVDSVRFGRKGARPEQAMTRDVDDDGYTDLVLVFRARDVGFKSGDRSVKLTARTKDGRKVVARADVLIRPGEDEPKRTEDERDDKRDDERKGKDEKTERRDRDDDRRTSDERRDRDDDDDKDDDGERDRDDDDKDDDDDNDRKTRDERRDRDDDDDDDERDRDDDRKTRDERRGRDDNDDDGKDDDDDDDDERGKGNGNGKGRGKGNGRGKGRGDDD